MKILVAILELQPGGVATPPRTCLRSLVTSPGFSYLFQGTFLFPVAKKQFDRVGSPSCPAGWIPSLVFILHTFSFYRASALSTMDKSAPSCFFGCALELSTPSDALHRLISSAAMSPVIIRGSTTTGPNGGTIPSFLHVAPQHTCIAGTPQVLATSLPHQLRYTPQMLPLSGKSKVDLCADGKNVWHVYFRRPHRWTFVSQQSNCFQNRSRISRHFSWPARVPTNRWFTKSLTQPGNYRLLFHWLPRKSQTTHTWGQTRQQTASGLFIVEKKSNEYFIIKLIVQCYGSTDLMSYVNAQCNLNAF